MNLLIHNANVIAGDVILPFHSVLIQNGVITSIAPDAQLACTQFNRMDAGGGILAPGFIDVHCHGTRMMLAERGRAELDALCGILPEFGATGFLPAVSPLESPEQDVRRLEELAGTSDPLVLGFLLEGHYLGLRGALQGSLYDANPERVRALIEACAPHKAVFAISPEIPGIQELLPIMTAEKTPAFITHTGADSGQTERAISLGAVHATHFYDVFPYPGDKEPGVRGCGVLEAVMAHPEVSVDFILDGEHVDPIAVKMALACKGPGNVCLITDANISAGMPAGTYHGGFGDASVTIANCGAAARLSDGSGIAGSSLTMDLAVRNAVTLLNLPITQAVRMASTNPANLLGLSKKGQIKEGYDADLVLLDNDCQVCASWVGGSCKYDRKITDQER